ncbi:hypothetical protein [Streptomyces sp. NPDC050704]|uniref:hypothetical protein n=1 Tax=Streptomyces sp. NPDC050704 TaxID=3157219 RepID=UPI003427F9D0
MAAVSVGAAGAIGLPGPVSAVVGPLDPAVAVWVTAAPPAGALLAVPVEEVVAPAPTPVPVVRLPVPDVVPMEPAALRAGSAAGSPG